MNEEKPLRILCVGPVNTGSDVIRALLARQPIEPIIIHVPLPQSGPCMLEQHRLIELAKEVDILAIGGPVECNIVELAEAREKEMLDAVRAEMLAAIEHSSVMEYKPGPPIVDHIPLRNTSDHFSGKRDRRHRPRNRGLNRTTK